MKFTLNKKITLGIWSIKVFKSPSYISSKLDTNKIKTPTISASDVKDVPAEFIADPFIIEHDSKYYMFFEILDKSSGKGIIGLASSGSGENWKYERAVLKESFHLSYPYVFKDEGDLYMIPESSEADKVILYKAKNFPYEWSIEAELISGKYVDSSIFKYKDKWWIFAGKSGKLHLFYSDSLIGNWMEHPMSPLISNNYSITRPGGRVIVDGDNIYRYTQDGRPHYGSSVRMFKISKLSELEYQEEEVSQVLNGSMEKSDWKKDGMHTIDQLKIDENEWIIAVDGHRLKRVHYIVWKIDRLMAKYFINKGAVKGLLKISRN